MAHLVRQQSLLAYLAMHRDAPRSRQHLAFLFWPDASETQARADLRKALYDLRKSLPDLDHFVQIEAQFLQWRNSTATLLDVEQFRASLTRAEQANQHEVARVALEQAVTLYTGELLPTCYDDWLLFEREQLRQRYIKALEQLTGLLEQHRELPGALVYAQRLLDCDPLHESTSRLLMRLHVLNGDRATALRIYHTCVTLLQQELGVGPSPETQQLYQRLLNRQDALSTSPNSKTPHATFSTARGVFPLVGRHPEWGTLQRAWRTAVAGNAHCVLIAGEAGIGKTRLAEELLQWADRQGYATARTRCYAAEGRLAYAPVTEWLRSDAVRTKLQNLEQIWLVEVARLLPELLIAQPELPPPAPLVDTLQLQRFREGLVRAIVPDPQPLLLVIDDLQWCDHETLEWLRYLLRLTAQEPLLVVGTVRSEEVGGDHPLRQLTLHLRHTEQVTEIELDPLNAQATADLATHVIGRALNAHLASHLYAETEGNPLFVVEMVRTQSASDLLDDSTSDTYQKVNEQHNGQVSALPPKVHAIIQHHLGQLSPQARELADLAATIGRSFTLKVLAQAGDTDEETLIHGLDELWQRRIIREQGINAYDFSHDKIREVAYAEVSRVRQQLYHRRIAQALEIVYASDTDAVSGRIALHYEQAGLFQQAVRYYQQAAETARGVYANQDAKALYSYAIEASHSIVPALNAEQLFPLYEGHALVCRSLTQLQQAIADFHVTRQLAHTMGNWQKEGESLCQLAYTHWLTFAENQMPFVEQYAQEATECFKETSDQRILARSLTMLGAVDQVNRKLASASQKLEEALQISRHIQDKEALVQALSFLCLQTYIQGDLQATMHYAQEGVTIARKVHDDFNELRIQAFLCQGRWSSGHYAQAFSLLQEVMAQAEDRGNRFVQGRLLNTLGWFHRELGDFAQAITYNLESVELGRASGIDNVEISALVNLGYDYLALGQLERAVAYLEPTLTRVEREGFGAHKWQWRMKIYLGLAEHAYHTGDQAQALSYVEAGLDEALATTSQKYVVKGWALRGKILTQMGQTEASGADFQRAFSLAEALQIPSLTYTLAFALGQWHETMGQECETATLYARAQATVEQMARAIGNQALEALFLQSNQVQVISESWLRTR